MSPTFGSLFAGIGGIDLGLERAGWECRFQVEWDDYCQRVLAKHWPDVPRVGDIHDAHAVSWHEGRPVADSDDGHGHADDEVRARGHQPRCSGCLEPVDLIAGGFPCQPFSVAGKRLGKDDDRWLWPEFARVVGALRPRYVLVENVTGLLDGHGGMGAVLGDLAALRYDAEWDCIPAAAVGAPHLRYRVWIVAVDRDVFGGEVVDPFGKRGRRGDDQREHAADADPPGQGVGPGGYGEWWAVEPPFRRVVDGLSQGLDGGRVGAGQGLGSGGDPSERDEGVLLRLWCEVVASPTSSRRRSDEQLARELADHLRELPHGPALGDGEDSMATAIAYVRGLRQAGEATGTLRDASQPLASTWVALSGQEADWWDLAARGGPWAAEWPGVGRVSTGIPARVDRLRALGNAVVPQVVEAIGRRILEADAVT